MTIAYYCVLIAGLLPYLFTVLAKTGPGFDNRSPRDYLQKTTGWTQRAHWTQLNSFEIFPFFAASIIIAQLSNKPQHIINLLAIAFILSRLLYGYAYISNKSTLRSTVWFIGLGIIVLLFVCY